MSQYISQVPSLMEQWDFDKNTIQPNEITTGAHQKVFWKCPVCQGEWSNIPHTAGKNSCPYCNKRKVLKGFNDLKTKNPELLCDWDYSLNQILPEEVTFYSNKKVFWRCSKCGHSWKATINSRTRVHAGCPNCAKGYKTSFPEQAIFFYLNKHFFCINNYKYDNTKKEIDIYIPSLRIGIEYNGSYYHSKSQTKDEKKKIDLQSLDIQLITIRNGKEDKITGDFIEHKLNNSSLEWAIKQLFKILYLEDNISLDDDYQDILKQYKQKECQNSLGKLYPDLLKEWDYNKNILNPLLTPPNSNRKAWWKCKKCGRSWQATINSRTPPHNNGCKKCSGIYEKAALCLENRKIYIGLNKLCKKLNVADGAVTNCIRKNKNKIGYCKGYHWKIYILHEEKNFSWPFSDELTYEREG